MQVAARDRGGLDFRWHDKREEGRRQCIKLWEAQETQYERDQERWPWLRCHMRKLCELSRSWTWPNAPILGSEGTHPQFSLGDETLCNPSEPCVVAPPKEHEDGARETVQRHAPHVFPALNELFPSTCLSVAKEHP